MSVPHKMCFMPSLSKTEFHIKRAISNYLHRFLIFIFFYFILLYTTMSRHKPLKWLESRRTHYQLNWMRNDAEKLVSSSIYSGFKSNFFLLISILGRYTSRIISIRNDGNCVEFASKSKKKSSRRQKKLS